MKSSFVNLDPILYSQCQRLLLRQLFWCKNNFQTICFISGNSNMMSGWRLTPLAWANVSGGCVEIMRNATLPDVFGGCCELPRHWRRPLPFHHLFYVQPQGMLTFFLFFLFSVSVPKTPVFTSHLCRTHSHMKCSILHFTLFLCVLLDDITSTLLEIWEQLAFKLLHSLLIRTAWISSEYFFFSV